MIWSVEHVEYVQLSCQWRLSRCFQRNFRTNTQKWNELYRQRNEWWMVCKWYRRSDCRCEQISVYTNINEYIFCLHANNTKQPIHKLISLCVCVCVEFWQISLVITLFVYNNDWLKRITHKKKIVFTIKTNMINCKTA